MDENQPSEQPQSQPQPEQSAAPEQPESQDQSQPGGSKTWIVVVLVIAIIGVLVWLFV